MSWKSYHLYLHDINKHEQLLKKIYKNINELKEKGFIESWFFIRYWMGGPHIRLRIKGRIPNNFIEHQQAILKKIALEKGEPINLTPSMYYENVNLESEKISREVKLPWYESGTINKETYEPEFERYGGKKLINISEKAFEICSELVLKMLNNNESKTNILLYSLVMIDYLAKESHPNYKGAGRKFFYTGALKWKEVFQLKDDLSSSKLIYFLEKNCELLRKLSEYLKESEYYDYLKNIAMLLNEIRMNTESEEYYWSILFSHFHMLNNRLGISPELEYIMYYYLSQKSLD
ncbi:thiopeptide-type bacteriocin biosynthesis protein [Bacillus cereus]|uniref:thiopeptide-type bacteriocin biosynthesis protein n=1 Tax=Bacillus cereus TaxID=1396 RepID=UPI0024BC868C|nr:thiopeptide-type bacteriocin biosynthesis protein [Bacillus cereus]WHT85050.1 thiopeptide-type bacteriocin biosynthesis protein [Bacillus cereus]WHT90189.1 thiopeptide-type bacteriocin biosynthesis protein [Bacillus cereus]